MIAHLPNRDAFLHPAVGIVQHDVVQVQALFADRNSIAGKLDTP